MCRVYTEEKDAEQQSILVEQDSLRGVSASTGYTYHQVGKVAKVRL